MRQAASPSEAEVTAAETAIADPAGMLVDRCDVGRADVPGLINPDRRDACGAEKIFGEIVLVAFSAYASLLLQRQRAIDAEPVLAAQLDVRRRAAFVRLPVHHSLNHEPQGVLRKKRWRVHRDELSHFE